MCGITGVLNYSGEPVSGEILRRMTRTLAHRGPDGEGIYLDGALGLGHRRLAILDVSERGSQPMTSEDGRYCISYNGEVFNFQDIRQDLRKLGYSFKSRADTEVVLKAFMEWGSECVERFNGFFAFAIWDRHRNDLFLARDRYGIKPLYFYQDSRRLVFASEIKAILAHPAVQFGVDEPALLEYFTFQNVFTERTLFSGVQILPPGNKATVTCKRGGALRIDRYWDYDFREPETRQSSAAYEEELSHLFEQAVRRQLVSDVPVGSYLSGGIDSGAITAVASQHIDNLQTFTGGFDLSSASGLELGYDERSKAEALSYRFKTEHYAIVMKAGDMERAMSKLVWHLEDLRVGQSYPNFYASKLASKFVKVALAGTGGDELFAGYPWRYFRAANALDYDAYVNEYYRYWQRLVDNTTIQRLFQPGTWSRIGDVQTIDIFQTTLNHQKTGPCSTADYVNRSLYFESKTFLHGLLVVEDRLSMAFGLETRVPFLDNDLVDFAMRLPVSEKLRYVDEHIHIDENDTRPKREVYFAQTNQGKSILRRVLGRHMPSEYVNSPKQGFSGPDGSWFRGDSIDYVRDLLLDPGAHIYNYLRRDTVTELLNEHLSGRKNRRLLVWSLLSFEWWNRVFSQAATDYIDERTNYSEMPLAGAA